MCRVGLQSFAVLGVVFGIAPLDLRRLRQRPGPACARPPLRNDGLAPGLFRPAWLYQGRRRQDLRLVARLGDGQRFLGRDESDWGAHKGDDARPPKEKIPLNGIGKHDWGAFPDNKEDMEDWQLAGWAAEYLAKPHAQPFFIACGIVKPHTPWYVPQSYFDLFPPDRVTIADLAKDETAGIPKVAREKFHRNDDVLVKRRKELVAAYLASSRYADDCVGRILDALEKSPYRANTLVVICGDNGYQFGEKNNWSKGKLWEGSTEVPLVIAGPGIAKGEVCTHAVSLLDIYPTLVELARLPANPSLDGTSIVPLLKNPSASWDRPVVTTARFQNHAIRSDRWRYIRYEDGSEELYDHDRDPLERNNLASQPESTAIKASLQKWLPKHDEPLAEPMGKGSDD